MTRREDEMLQRIYSLEGQLVKAATMITEERERAEAVEKALAWEKHERKELNGILVARAEAAEKWAAEIHQSMEDQHERNATYQEELLARAEAAEKRTEEAETYWKDYTDAMNDAWKDLAEAAEKRVKELEDARGLWPHWGERPDGFDGPGGAE